MDTLEKAFQLYIQGFSLRNLEKRFKIPKSTLSFRFKKRYGDNYSSLKNKEGVMSVINEYLRSPSLSRREKDIIKSWLYLNLSSVIDSDIRNHQTPLFSDSKLDKLTREQCSRREKDWKTLFEAMLTA